MSTTLLGLPLMFEGQTGNELQYNEMIHWVDALMRHGAKDIENTPPGSPAQGDVYIIGDAPTGDWAGLSDRIATYIGTAWKTIVPAEGWRLWVDDVNETYVWDGSAWVTDGVKDESIAVTGSVSKYVGKHIVRATATLTLTLPDPTSYTTLEQSRTEICLIVDGSHSITLDTPSGTFRSQLASSGVASPVINGPYIVIRLQTNGTDWIVRTQGLVA